jgi:hypothetical protein
MPLVAVTPNAFQDSTDSFRFPLVKQQFLNLTRIEREFRSIVHSVIGAFTFISPCFVEPDHLIIVFQIAPFLFCHDPLPGLDGVSILILANKQDKPGAKSAEVLRTELGISNLLRNQRRMLKVQQCSITDPESVIDAVNWAVTSGCSGAASTSSPKSPGRPLRD